MDIQRKYKIILFSQQEEIVNAVSKAIVRFTDNYSFCNTYEQLLAESKGTNNCILIADSYRDNSNGKTLLQKLNSDTHSIPPSIFIINEDENNIIDQLIDDGIRDFIIADARLEENAYHRIHLLFSELNRENNSINKIINLFDDFVIIRELDGTFINVNDSCLKGLKYTQQEFLNMNPEDFIAPHALFDYRQEIRILIDKKTNVFQTDLITHNKDIIPVEVSSSISTYKGSSIIVSVARNISDRIETNEKLKDLNSDLERINAEYKIQNSRLRNINREVEENRHALKLALKEAENAEKLKNKFLANMSHELRTPMNAIVGFSQLLDDADPEDVPDFVKIINSNSETLLQLINDLMDIAKIESDLVAINTQPVCVHDLMLDLQTIYNFEKLNKEKRHIEIIYNPTEDTKLEIETDKLRIKQVMMNLMGNALKFTEEGSVEIGFNRKKDGVNIFVKDTGIGIPIKMQKQIFERFHQIEYGTKPQGTGIGLSISRSLIRLLGGDINIDSKENEGSVFNVFHPISQSGNNKVKPPQKNMVMIAEDEEDNYHLLKYVLKDLNLDVIWAKNGQEAIDLCKHKNVSLVLMDIKMPNKSGLEATKEILEFQPNLPIIAQTAYTQDEDIENCRRAGCSEFVAKPINLTHLRRVIAKYI